MLRRNDQETLPLLTELRLEICRLRSRRQGWHLTQQPYGEESPRHVQKKQGVGSVQQAGLPLRPDALRDGRAKYDAETSET